jgi:pentapeptide MXKDX repeat protein
MNTKHLITRFAALAFVVVDSMYAGTASAEETMKSETATQDHMKGDAMKGDHMKGDAMKGDDAMGGTQK